MIDMRSELCKRCIHTKVCHYDKNLVGDIFVPGNPMIFDNLKLWEEYKEREKAGFPCEDFFPVITRCKDCKYWHDDGIITTCEKHIGNSIPREHFCSWGEEKVMDSADHE